MLSEGQRQTLSSWVRVVQIAAGTVIFACLVMTCLIILIFVDLKNLEPATKMLTLFGAVAGMMLYSIGFFIPGLLGSENLRRRTEKSGPISDKDFRETLNGLVVEQFARYAMIGVGLVLNAIVLMMDPQRTTMFLIGVGFLFMFILFPRLSVLQNQLAIRLMGKK
ncbi:MAG: hypothetical protein AAF623_00245 [Planctomycetota bacterium]